MDKNSLTYLVQSATNSLVGIAFTKSITNHITLILLYILQKYFGMDGMVL